MRDVTMQHETIQESIHLGMIRFLSLKNRNTVAVKMGFIQNGWYLPQK